MGVLNWIKLFSNKRITLFCDNDSVVQMINNSTSNCRNCMVLIRLLTAKSIMRNVRIFAKHVRTKANGKVDALSRLDFNRFRRLAGESMNDKPTVVPREIWPLNKLWIS